MVAALVEGEVENLISDLLSRLSPPVRDSRWKTYVYLEYRDQIFILDRPLYPIIIDPSFHHWTSLSLVSSLHVPRGKYDTWNTPGEGYIDYRTLAVYPFATSSVNTPSLSKIFAVEVVDASIYHKFSKSHSGMSSYS